MIQAMSLERTFIIIKPDGMQKNLTGVVLQRFTQAGLRPVACKMMRLTEPLLREHYAHLADKPFFPSILSYMQQSPVMMFVLEGEQAISKGRELLGPTDSKLAPKGTIRGDFGVDKSTNVAHASDSADSARQEIARFFKPEEIFG